MLDNGSMVKSLALAFGALAALLMAAPTAYADPDCRCRSDGEFYVQGEHTCIKTNHGYRLARCDMVLNNTSWVVVGDSCPLSGLPAVQDPKDRVMALASGTGRFERSESPN